MKRYLSKGLLIVSELNDEEIIKKAMSLLAKRSAGKKKNVDPQIAKERSQKAVEAKRRKKEGKPKEDTQD